MVALSKVLDDRSVSSVASVQDRNHPDNATIQDRDTRERGHKETSS